MALPSGCPLCGAGNHLQNVVTNHVFGETNQRQRAFFHCQLCDVRYLFPLLTPDEESEFYSAEFENFMTKRSGSCGGWDKAESHVRANEITRMRRMRYIDSYLNFSRNVLEVGCSSGFMLYPLLEDGKACIGIEPSGVFSDYVQSRGIRVFRSIDKLRESMNDIQFDLIMHFFVLEHISSPLVFLKEQLELLRPGGRLIFEVPNVADPLYSVYDIPAFEQFYWSIAHSWYFSEASLSYLLDKVGLKYEILRDQRYDLSNHISWALDGKPGGMSRYTNKLGIKLEESYMKGLIESGYCDTLVGIISKEDVL